MKSTVIKFADTVQVFLSKVFAQGDALNFISFASGEEPDTALGEKSFTLSKFVSRGLVKYKMVKAATSLNNVYINPATSRILPVSQYELAVGKIMSQYPCNLSGLGLTYVKGDSFFFHGMTCANPGGAPININLSNNALTVTAVDGLLQYFQSWKTIPSCNLNLSGGTNAVPGVSGQSYKTQLIAGGWTVTTN